MIYSYIKKKPQISPNITKTKLAIYARHLLRGLSMGGSSSRQVQNFCAQRRTCVSASECASWQSNVRRSKPTRVVANERASQFLFLPLYLKKCLAIALFYETPCSSARKMANLHIYGLFFSCISKQTFVVLPFSWSIIASNRTKMIFISKC